MGWQAIETVDDLDAALRAWSRWKESSVGGYPPMDPIARARCAVGGSVPCSRVPRCVDVPWDVALCLRGMEAMQSTSIGRWNVAALHCHYLIHRAPEAKRIEWLSDWMQENRTLFASAGSAMPALRRAAYFERVARAREMLLDWVQRHAPIERATTY